MTKIISIFFVNGHFFLLKLKFNSLIIVNKSQSTVILLLKQNWPKNKMWKHFGYNIVRDHLFSGRSTDLICEKWYAVSRMNFVTVSCLVWFTLHKYRYLRLLNRVFRRNRLKLFEKYRFFWMKVVLNHCFWKFSVINKGVISNVNQWKLFYKIRKEDSY